MRSVIVVLVLLAACSSSPERSAPAGQPPSPPSSRRPGMDTLCFNDCLGAGTDKSFCEERCSY
jgi:hypothetical protein